MDNERTGSKLQRHARTHLRTDDGAMPSLAPTLDASPRDPADTAVPAAACAFEDADAGVWLYQANCLAFMDAVADRYADGLFDLIFADPPYFLSNGGITCHAGKMVTVDKGSWDQSQGADLNHEFNFAWLSRCQKVLKPNGTIWVSGTHHVIHSVGFAMQQLGMKILNDIVWEKPNPPPNLSCRYFTHAGETLIWAAKNKNARHTFNYELMKSCNSGKQMKSVWRMTAPKREEKTFGKHPTQKPIALLERVMLSASNEGDIVFDPFAGSSTTGVAAIGTNRQFVGCELEDEFILLSKRRLAAALQEGSTELLSRAALS